MCSYNLLLLLLYVHFDGLFCVLSYVWMATSTLMRVTSTLNKVIDTVLIMRGKKIEKKNTTKTIYVIHLFSCHADTKTFWREGRKFKSSPFLFVAHYMFSLGTFNYGHSIFFRYLSLFVCWIEFVCLFVALSQREI